MPQSFAKVFVHLVFSTKGRRPLLDATRREPMHRMIGTVSGRLNSPVVSVGGAEDHVHVSFSMSRMVTIAEAVRVVKSSTSKWMNESETEGERFEWQSGYGIFSVSCSNLPEVKQYIETQEEHHRKFSFQDEFRALMKKHEYEYDERYVWD